MSCIFGVSLSETRNKFVLKSLDGSFGGILEMNMRGNNIIRDIFLMEGLLEDITRCIVHDLELGIATRSCEYI